MAKGIKSERQKCGWISILGRAEMKTRKRSKPNRTRRKKRNLGQHGCTIAIREGFMAIAVTQWGHL